eukprot:Gb_21494 [translate_table: standard]
MMATIMIKGAIIYQKSTPQDQSCIPEFVFLARPVVHPHTIPCSNNGAHQPYPEGVLSKSFLCRPPIPPTREAITIEPKGLLEGEISDGMLPSPRPNIEFETEQEIQTVGTSLKSKGNDSSIISA